jgi:hypothetical protein
VILMPAFDLTHFLIGICALPSIAFLLLYILSCGDL